jgi:hypothetical protein
MRMLRCFVFASGLAVVLTAGSPAFADCGSDCQLCLADCKAERTQCINDANAWYGECISSCNQFPYEGCQAECGRQKTSDYQFCNSWALNCQQMCYNPGAAALVQSAPAQTLVLKDALKKVKATSAKCRAAAVQKVRECRASCPAGTDCEKRCGVTKAAEVDVCYGNALLSQQTLILHAVKNP